MNYSSRLHGDGFSTASPARPPRKKSRAPQASALGECSASATNVLYMFLNLEAPLARPHLPSTARAMGPAGMRACARWLDGGLQKSTNNCLALRASAPPRAIFLRASADGAGAEELNSRFFRAPPPNWWFARAGLGRGARKSAKIEKQFGAVEPQPSPLGGERRES